MSGLSFFQNRRIIFCALLGFSSSLPLALTGSTLQAWFAASGVNLMTIGALSLVGLPYIWKFAWAPIVDRVIPPFMGRRRGWIALMQIALAIMLFIMAQFQPEQSAMMIGGIAVFIAFLSSTQSRPQQSMPFSQEK